MQVQILCLKYITKIKRIRYNKSNDDIIMYEEENN